jgi:hypothetical protein
VILELIQVQASEPLFIKFIISIEQMKKTKVRGDRELYRDHAASEWGARTPVRVFQ